MDPDQDFGHEAWKRAGAALYDMMHVAEDHQAIYDHPVEPDWSNEVQELKWHDVGISETGDLSAGVVCASLNLIPESKTEITRRGLKIICTHISFRYDIDLPQWLAVGVPGEASPVRIILFLDKQCNGAAAAVTDVLLSAEYNSFINLYNQGRFDILMDKIHNINYGAGGPDATCDCKFIAGYGMSYHWEQDVHLMLDFDGPDDVIGEVTKNNLGLLIITRTSTPNVIGRIRLRFHS